MGSLLQDLRYGIRMLLKNPGFTAIAVLTLALGIGGNATVFGWVQAVLLHPLPGIQHSDRLAAIETIMPNGEYHTSSYPDFRDYRDQNQVLSGLIGFELVPVNMTWAANNQEQRVWGEIVTENYFDVLGVRAERGRLFQAKDAGALNGDPYIVLSYPFWQRQFGGTPTPIGKTVDINNQIPVINGRDFTEQDRQGAPLVVIVNQTMAKRFWPGQSAIGHRIFSWHRWWTIVGVVKDIKYHTMTEQREAFVYFPSLENGETDANVLIRSSGNLAGLLGEVRKTAKSLDPGVMVLQAGNLDELVHISLFSYRTAAALSATLGALGLLLATIGLYGVLSYSVSQRTHEIGVRMALGAQPLDVVSLVIGQGARLVGIGIIVGIAASLAVTRLMSSLLFGVTAGDPLTFVSVAVLLTLVALAACYIPARRAMRLDPNTALRYE